MEAEGGEAGLGPARGLGADDQTGLQPRITSQFEPKSRASHGLLQLREKGDRRVGTEVCNGAWTGGQAYGLLFEDAQKRKRRDWEISSDDEYESEHESEYESESQHGDGGMDGYVDQPEGKGDQREAGGRLGAVGCDGAEQPSLDLRPADCAVEKSAEDNGMVELQMGCASNPVTRRGADEKDEVERGREAVSAKDNDADVDDDIDDDEEDDEDNDDNDDDFEIDLEIDLEMDDEEACEEEDRVATDHGGNSDLGTTNLCGGPPDDHPGTPNSEQPATTETAADVAAQEISPQSLSLCALPCSAEGTPSMPGPTRSAPSLAPFVHSSGMENPENTSTVNGTTNIAVGTPLAAAGWVSADRLALAIMGNDSVADIRNVLAGFAPGTGFAVGSESKLPPALVCACQDHNERNTFIVSALLEHGADVNESYRGDGFTPLIQCAKTGNLEMIELLLEAGADVERVSKDGRSALSVAIGNGRTDMARRLLPPRGRADALRVDCGRTALMEAARRGQYDVATALVEHGADVDLVDDCQKTALMLSLEEGVSNKKLLKLLMSERSVNLADEMGATPLEVAVSKKIAAAPQLLVDAQCDLGGYRRKVPGTDETRICFPLIHAIVHNAGTLLVRKMLERGASPQCAVDGKTALMHAAEVGDSQIVSDLIKAGADPLVEHGNRMNALMWAARMGHKSVSRVLMAAMGIGPPSS